MFASVTLCPEVPTLESGVSVLEGPGATDDRPLSPRRGEAQPGRLGVVPSPPSSGRLRSFELPGLAGPGGRPRGDAVPSAGARPFKLLFLKLWGCGRGPPRSVAGCSLATRRCPAPRLPDAVES